MLFSDIAYIDQDFRVREHGWVGVRDGRVAYLGDREPADAASYGRIYPGRGKLLVNGFFNVHAHTPMALLRGYAESMALQDWLHKKIFPFEDRLTPEDVYWATLLGCAEMLRYGIVGVSDMYMKGRAMGEGFRDGGVKANFCIGASNFGDDAYPQMRQYRETLQMREDFHGLEEGRLKVDWSMHAEYTSHEKMVRTLAETAQQYPDMLMQVHVSETEAEVEACRERHHGLSPVEYLDDCGLFRTPTTAAHCVHLSDHDIELLAARGVTVATCPKSNLKLASGVAPLRRLWQAGVNVALGTDSVSSNNNLNMTEEMRVFALLHKGVTGDPTLVTPAQALAAATVCGAKAQGRPDCGLIKEGNRADLVVFDVSGPHMQPVHDLLNNLVYSADGADVRLTMVDGKIRYEDGDWPHLDMEKICARVESSRRRILSELGV
ncbi:MAG: amidohydrolase [Firmicutes bacterium]|nr:amidohydrolase [Bacillota bacterium]